MKQKLLLILCFVMLVLEVKAEYSKIENYAYYSTKSTYFLNNYDILRNAGDTPDQIAHGEITYMGITKVTIDNNNISIDQITSSNTYRRYLITSALEIYCHNTSKSNCIAPIESATASTNSSNDYQYGFNITYYRNKPQTFDIYGEINFKYYDSFYKRSFHLRITPGTQYTNGIRFTSSTTSTTPQTNPITVFTNEVLTLYTYSQYSSSLNSSYTGETYGISRVSDDYNSISKYHTATYECIKPGTYTMLVSQNGVEGSYFESRAERTINVILRPNDLSISNSNLYIQKGIASQTLSALKTSGSSTGDLSYSYGSVTSSTGVSLVQGTDYYITNGVFYAKKAGTYNIIVKQAETDLYESITKTITLKVYDMPDILSVLNVKPNEDLDLISAIKNYKPVMSPAFSCDDANATVSSTTFSSEVEGEYFVNVTTESADYLIGREARVRVVVSNHNHGKVTMHLHYDEYNDEYNYPVNGDGPLNDEAPVVCNHECYYIPEWDFTFPVSTSNGYKNVRFCINEDGESVTLVSGIPVSNTSRTYKYITVSELNSHTPTGHGTPIADPYGTSIQQFYFRDPKNIIEESRDQKRIGKSCTIPLLEEQNDIIYDDVVDFYNIEGDLSIPEYVSYGGKDYKVTEIGVNALQDSQELYDDYNDSYLFEEYDDARHQRFIARIKNLNLPKTTERIGAYAFSMSPSGSEPKYPINSVNFTDLLNLERIDGSAFYCTQIENLDLTKCTKLESIGESAFMFCYKLEKVNMSGLQNFSGYSQDSKTYDWRDTFSRCTALVDVDMSNMPQLNIIGEGLFNSCRSLKIEGLKLDNTPILEFRSTCFEYCTGFNGGVFDLRKVGKLHYDGYTTERPINLRGICEIPVLGIICDHELTQMNYSRFYSNPVYIFLLHPQARFHFYQDNKNNIMIFTPYENVFKSGYVQYGPGARDRFTTTRDSDTETNNSDNHGLRIFPILRAKSSDVRTMSYFRPLDFKSVKVFDNTHSYGSTKSDGTKYQFGDFFRTNTEDIEMLKAYIATGYDAKAKTVTMTALGDEKPGIETLGGIYYRGRGTAVDSEDNEVLYILTQPEYTGREDSKTYTNMYSGTNYLKGGGKDAVNMTGAPHMTDESTQFISKGGTFYYCTGGTLGAFKAYLDLPVKILTAADEGYGSSNAKVSSLSFIWEDAPADDATSVEAITDFNASSGDYYNMQGMKVKVPQAGGIYIHNGRKVIMK